MALTTIIVQRAKVRDRNNKWVEKATKTTNSTRTINAPQYIMNLLKAERGDAPSEAHVVKIKGNCLYHRLKVILRKNGLPDIRFRDGCIKIELNQKQPHSKGHTDLVLF